MLKQVKYINIQNCRIASPIHFNNYPNYVDGVSNITHNILKRKSPSKQKLTCEKQF